jgi:predicted transcriptional regulator
MSNREIVIDLVGKLPEDTPLEEIARQIDLLAGIRAAREQARRGEGVPAEEVRKLVDTWASQSF